ncbi:MAG: hypothetical protein J6X98_10650, partial [Bacteroidales bacterium]|nr:hypothetical protein [Bacteroidales bacterium]
TIQLKDGTLATVLTAHQDVSGFLTEHQDISGKADIADIPTSTSQLTNDSGFLTSQDISGKANKSEMIVTPGTGENVDKTTIQLKDGTLATVLTAHQDVSGFLTEHQDISGKANISDIPTSTSQLTNDSGFLTAQDISGKADKAEMIVTPGTGENADKTTIQLKDGTSATVLTTHQDVSGFLTAHQDISGKADKNEMSVTVGTGADADKTTIQLKSGTTATVLNAHQDISGKADKGEMSITPGTEENADKTTIQLKDNMSATVLTTHQDISGKADKAEMIVTPGTGENADKTTIQLKDGTSATVLTTHQDVSGFLTAHQDISGKANKSEMIVTPGTGENADKTTIQLKEDMSATVLTTHQDISGKADKSEMIVTEGTGTDADKTTIQLRNGVSATVLRTHQDISGKANTSDLASVATSGNYSDLNGVPTNVSTFNNDAKYLTRDSIAALQATVNSLVALVNSLNMRMTEEQFTATAGQIVFTLQHDAKTDCIVRLYINGVMIGGNHNGVLEINANNPKQVQYNASLNRNYSLKANDKVTIVYWY